MFMNNNHKFALSYFYFNTISYAVSIFSAKTPLKFRFSHPSLSQCPYIPKNFKKIDITVPIKALLNLTIFPKYYIINRKIKKTAKWLSQLQISVGYCNTLRRCLLQDSMPYLRAVDGY